MVLNVARVDRVVDNDVPLGSGVREGSGERCSERARDLGGIRCRERLLASQPLGRGLGAERLGRTLSLRGGDEVGRREVKPPVRVLAIVVGDPQERVLGILILYVG